MFVIFTLGLVLTVCVMGNVAVLNGCERCCDDQDTDHNHNSAYYPSFMAELSTALPSLTRNQSIAFANVHFNVGDNYNSETGIFTVPVNGSYVFNLAAHSDNIVDLGIFFNDLKVGKVDKDRKSSTVIINMVQNDRAHVKVTEVEEIPTPRFSTFSGYNIN